MSSPKLRSSAWSAPGRMSDDTSTLAVSSRHACSSPSNRSLQNTTAGSRSRHCASSSVCQLKGQAISSPSNRPLTPSAAPTRRMRRHCPSAQTISQAHLVIISKTRAGRCHPPVTARHLCLLACRGQPISSPRHHAGSHSQSHHLSTVLSSARDIPVAHPAIGPSRTRRGGSHAAGQLDLACELAHLVVVLPLRALVRRGGRRRRRRGRGRSRALALTLRLCDRLLGRRLPCRSLLCCLRARFRTRFARRLIRRRGLGDRLWRSAARPSLRERRRGVRLRCGFRRSAELGRHARGRGAGRVALEFLLERRFLGRGRSFPVQFCCQLGPGERS